MEGIARLVAESMARSGYEPPSRLEWSRWIRCESSLSVLLVPARAGIFALGEEVMAQGENAATGGKRLLAVFHIGEADDLALGLGRLFMPASPLRERLGGARCFVRFAVVEDDAERRSASAALQRWLADSAESASGLAMDAEPAGTMPQLSATAGQKPRLRREIKPPAPLPAGF